MRHRSRPHCSSSTPTRRDAGRPRNRRPTTSLWLRNRSHGRIASKADPAIIVVRRRDGDSVRLFINIGRNLGVRPQDIVGAIGNEAGIPGRSIGAIDIFDGYSFVDVPANMADRVVDALIRSGIKGRSVNAEIARPDAMPRQDRVAT